MFASFFLALLSTHTFAITDVQNYALEHQVTCSGCPAGLATVVVEQLDGHEFCRGALISPNQILTNAHCVDELLNSCDQVVAIKIGDEAIACKNILKAQITENDLNQPDYALVELEHDSKATPLPLYFQTFQDNQPLHYYKSTYNLKNKSSSLKKIECKTKKYSSAIGSFFSENPQVLAIKDCTFDQGDSGSPIFNEHQQVVALQQGGINKEALFSLAATTLAQFDNKSYLDLLSANFNFADSKEVQFNEVIAATNLSCIPELHSGMCDSKGLVEHTQARFQEIQTQFQSYIQTVNSRSRIRWTFQYSKAFDELLESKHPAHHSQADFHKIILAKAQCLQTAGEWIQPQLNIDVSVDANFAIYYGDTHSTHKLTATPEGLSICSD